MKLIPPTSVDRLATADEILAAAVIFHDPNEEYSAEIRREIAADLAGLVRIRTPACEISQMVEELTHKEDTPSN